MPIFYSIKSCEHSLRRYSILFAAFAIVLCLPIITARAQQSITKRPITHEDVWLMKRVGAPVPSPDGKWVVFSVVEPAYDEKDQVSDLWIVPADGSAKPRRLTGTKGSESGNTWSPDSRSIAFSAKRDGDEVNQIYLLNVVGGGEATRVTNLSTGARGPQFSTDGRMIIFSSSVYPGANNDEENKRIANERKARKYRARVYESFPIRNWDRWLDEMQSHVFVQSLEPGAKAKDLLAGTKLVSEMGFSGAIGAGSDELQPVWSPDGQSIVFVAMTNRNAAAYSESNTNLYQVSINGGEPRQLTTGKDSYSRPTFSPDGKTLYSSVNPNTEKVYNLNRLVSFAWPAMGERKVITASFDRAPSSFALTPDSKTVYLLAEEAGHEKLFSVPATGGQVILAMDMTLGVYTNLAIPGRASSPLFFANWESAVNPAEVVRIDLSSKTQKALSDFNAERIAQIDSLPLRHFWFTGKRGKKVHSLIVLPPKFDENKKYPLFVFIHGGPHTMTRDQFFLRWNYHLLAQPGYVILMTDYTGSTGYGEKFAQEIQSDPLKGPGEELNEAADEAIKQFKYIDGSRQAAGGASYGGHLANWLQATTTRYKCLISHAGLVNLESQWGTSDTIYSREVNNGGPVWEQGPVWREQNPIRYAAKFRTPMLITVGENDFRVPLNNSIENWSVLQRLRIPSKLVVFPEENHWILKGENSRFFYGEVHAWLKKWLGGENTNTVRN
ncbi:MAG: S9 family peptidase [Acidobacteria bacterium]|nr:S9 family peptidase [Acidobacteriota bacterium]